MKQKEKAWTGSVNRPSPPDLRLLHRKGAYISSKSLRVELGFPLSKRNEKQPQQLINTPIEHSANEISYSPGQLRLGKTLPDGELRTEDIAIFLREMCHREDSSGYLAQNL